MLKLRKIGLLFMLLGAILATIYPFWYNYVHLTNPHLHWDTQGFLLASLPALIVTGLSWTFPAVGGFVAAGLSLIAFLYYVGSILNPSMEPTTNYLFLAITLCFSLGSTMLLICFFKTEDG